MKARKRTRTTKTGFLYLVLVAMALGIVGCKSKINIEADPALKGNVVAELFPEELSGSIQSLTKKCKGTKRITKISADNIKAKRKTIDRSINDKATDDKATEKTKRDFKDLLYKDNGVRERLTVTMDDHRTTEYRLDLLPGSKEESKVTIIAQPTEKKLELRAFKSSDVNKLDSNLKTTIQLKINTTTFGYEDERKLGLAIKDWGDDIIDVDTSDEPNESTFTILTVNTPCTLSCTDDESNNILNVLTVGKAKYITGETFSTHVLVKDEGEYTKSGSKIKFDDEVKKFVFKPAITVITIKYIGEKEGDDSNKKHIVEWSHQYRGKEKKWVYYKELLENELVIEPEKFAKLVEEQIKGDKILPPAEQVRAETDEKCHLLLKFRTRISGAINEEEIRRFTHGEDEVISLDVPKEDMIGFEATLSRNIEASLYRIRDKESLSLIGDFDQKGKFSIKNNSPDLRKDDKLRVIPSDENSMYEEATLDYEKGKERYDFVLVKKSE